MPMDQESTRMDRLVSVDETTPLVESERSRVTDTEARFKRRISILLFGALVLCCLVSLLYRTTTEETGLLEATSLIPMEGAATPQPWCYKKLYEKGYKQGTVSCDEGCVIGSFDCDKHARITAQTIAEDSGGWRITSVTCDWQNYKYGWTKTMHNYSVTCFCDIGTMYEYRVKGAAYIGKNQLRAYAFTSCRENDPISLFWAGRSSSKISRSSKLKFSNRRGGFYVRARGKVDWLSRTGFVYAKARCIDMEKVRSRVTCEDEGG